MFGVMGIFTSGRLGSGSVLIVKSVKDIYGNLIEHKYD